jgi:hypothetical protein
MTDLENFLAEANKNSPFLKFEDGEPAIGLYRGAKIVDDTFNPGKQTMEYTLEVEGVKKTFKSGSTKLARLIRPIKEGEKIQLVKTGTSFKTMWYLEKK